MNTQPEHSKRGASSSDDTPRDHGPTVSRRSVLKSAGALALGGLGFAGRARAQSTAIPTALTGYQVRIAGQTTNGNFEQAGQFYVSPSLEQTPTNPRDVALVVGNPYGSPEVGSLAFYTNTALRTALNTGGAPTVNDARIKIGTVQVDEGRGLLAAQPRDDQGIDLPPGVRAGLQVNVFTPRAGIVAPLYEIVSGQLAAGFRGTQVAGTVEFTGISLGGAADQATVAAQFAGTA